MELNDGTLARKNIILLPCIRFLMLAAVKIHIISDVTSHMGFTCPVVIWHFLKNIKSGLFVNVSFTKKKLVLRAVNTCCLC